MEEWWASLDIFDQIIWVIAVTTSTIFLVQLVMTFVGMDADAGLEADFDGDMSTDDGQMPFQLFTFRNFVNFFLGFSWTIIAFKGIITSQALLVIVGTAVGVGLVALMMYLVYVMLKLQQSGTMNIKEAVGKSGEVYLTVPGYKNGLGKIHIKLQGTLRELDAITDADTLPSGSLVKVTGIVEDRILLVEKLLQ